MPRTLQRRRVVGSVAGVLGLAVLLLGGQGTMALWSDAKTIEGTTLTTGRVDLAVNGQDVVSGFSALSMTNILPGASRAADLTVANNGNVPTTYSVGFTGDDPSLTPALSKRVTTGTAAGGSCTGTALTGSPTLVPGATQQLCVEVGLPSGASSTLAGRTTNLGINVTGRTLGGHWPDPVQISGTQVTTQGVAAPIVSCANRVTDVVLAWESVGGATGYRVFLSGLQVGGDLDAGTTSKVVDGGGAATVVAKFGDSWLSDPSPVVNLSKVASVTSCLL